MMVRQPKKPSLEASGKTLPKRASKPKPPAQKHVPRAVPIVGLGASAGGVQAFIDFFEAIPDKSGMAFVAIHHVHPDHESMMAELLAKHTKMTVALAKNDTPIAPDHVYIIPPKQFLRIENSTLYLTEPTERRGMRMPIDYFLRSLALDKRENAIAVILSGTGGDGTAGIRSIKESGGIVLVQDPKEAEHDGMPRSAIASCMVDHILPVAKMPVVISNYIAHPYSQTGSSTKVLGENARGALSDIIAVLKAHTPINFENYKQGTLLRRIERRMALRHLENATDYLAVLKDSYDEVEKLCADFLISVTSFFRDPETFEYLAEHVIRDLVANCPSGQPIRIWVPACATGEEVYSLAILVLERIYALRKDVKLQIFASDADEHALSVARAGIYPDVIAADVSPTRLTHFFEKEDHSYRIKPELRDVVVFAHHNILADAPFSKLDLISCRNLLIYLNAEAQERVIQMFHFALNDDGLLLLGASETANNHELYFKAQSKKHRLYKRVGLARHGRFDFPIAKNPIFGRSATTLRGGAASHGIQLAELSQKLLIDRYAPAAVLINTRMEVLFVQGPTDQYLKVPPGAASQNVLNMARDGLRSKLGNTVRVAFTSDKDVTTSGTLTRAGHKVPVSLTAHPLTVDGAKLVLVTFVDQLVTGAEAEDDSQRDAALQTRLEQELETMRAELQTTIHEYELSTEELKASHEEAMSMNEEFQSTNEELETSKEELQSLNEELTTINTQLQQKVEDERRLTDDLNNLLSSSGIATLFLDRDFNIMRFTPKTRDIFNVIANDVGRPFSDITGKIDDPALLTDAAKVLAQLVPIKLEVQAKYGKWYIRHILPYRTQDGKIGGVVVTFTDVTDIKVLHQANEDALQFAESIIGTISEPLLVLDADLKVVKASRSFFTTFKTTAENVKGNPLFELQNGQWNQPELRKLLERVLPEKTSVEGHMVELVTTDQDVCTMRINARQLNDQNGRVDFILLVIDDITEQHRIQHELEEREERLSAIINAAPEAIVTIDAKGIITSYSPAACPMLGYTSAEVIGQNIKMLMPAEHQRHHDDYIANYIKTKKKKMIGSSRELKARHKDGTEVPIRLTVAEWWSRGEQNFTGIMHDLTEDMKRRDALQHAQKMEAVGQLTGGVAHDFNNLLTVIIGNLELLSMHLGDFGKKELLAEALEASELGAKLTAQLLAFSRKQTLEPTIVALNDIVTAFKPLLVRALGDDITIKTELAKDLRLTHADLGQVEATILNLAINSRDAMNNGGDVTIRTRNVTLDKTYAATQVDVDPGDYVALSVADTGKGMTPDQIAHAFEPFFTTKGIGAGSGLGLSMVYGFVKQSGGHVTIDSAEGKGTTVTVFLPTAAQSSKVVESHEDSKIVPSHNETILVVEDDPRVRQLTVTRLESLGYHALAVANGPTALKTLRNTKGINLILSDVVMPGGLNGFEVADQALVINPALKVLLATGYANNSAKAASNKYHIVHKPYRLHDLAKALRELLD
ncbi:chemotaxis protein CheB [Pseudorhodobacter sp. W20_MBD10_FR17]|uniref:chemotaxis protein CheB n=1 Tax=Pseudorhodobacter sp. W20_MBD10_FR17 TaxID=3240266 RepID=UPI003F9769CD